MWERVRHPQAPVRRPALATLRRDEGRADDEAPLADAPRQAPAPRRRVAPVFGPAAWALGVTAALPALLSAVVLLACAGAIPRLPPLSAGPALGILLLSLGIGAVVAHATNYPAWTHPGIALIPILALVVPVVALHGQIVTAINGDSDPLVVAPLLIVWLLLVAGSVVSALVTFAVGHRAPSFSGVPLLPLPLFLTWGLILAPPFAEGQVLRALGSALTLAALATFVAWIAPQRARASVPLAAVGAQFGLFWLRRFRWPVLNGAVRPLIALDLLLLVGLLTLIAVAPSCAAWVRRDAWPVLRRVLGVGRE